MRNGLAANGEFYQIGHVRDIQSVLGNTVTVCYNLKLGKGRLLVYGNIRCARYLLDNIDNFIGNMTRFRDIFPVYLQCKITVRTCYLIHHHVNNRLGETYRISRHGHERIIHRFNQLGFIASCSPAIVRFQSYTTLDVRKGKGFCTFIVTSHLCHYVRHFRKLPQFIS